MHTSNRFFSLGRRLRNENAGVIATEYALIIAVIAITAALGMAVLGGGMQSYFDTLSNRMQSIGDSLLDPPEIGASDGGGIDNDDDDDDD